MENRFLVAQKKCDQCLFSPQRVVSAERAGELIQAALACDSYFECHKSTLAGKHICCRGFFDVYGRDSLATRIALMFHVVEEVDVEHLQEMPLPDGQLFMRDEEGDDA